MLRLTLAACFAAACALLPRSSGAQPPPPGVDAALDAARDVRGASIDISVLTFGPGEVLWERFGHNALIVADAATGQRLAYNWGVFDFNQPNFLTRFLTGDTRYWLAVYLADEMFAEYVSNDRTARLQVLDLTNVQRAALAEFVAWQAQEENRYYRYDYYLDNCSTRVRDAIDRVLGGTVAAALSDVPASPTTWREQTALVTDGDWPPFAGIHVALGRNADRELTRWQESFMPGLLANHLATVRLTGPDGATRSLVEHDSVLYLAQRAPLPERAPFRGFVSLVIGAVAGGIIFALGVLRIGGNSTGGNSTGGNRTGGNRTGGNRAATILLRIIATLWYLIGGLLGTALLLAGTVTKHAPYMGSNGSLFQVHPLLLLAACCAPFAGGAGRAARTFSKLAILIAVLSIIGAILQMTVLAQDSLVVIAVTLPVHVALAGVLALAVRSDDHVPSAPASAALSAAA